MDGRNWVINLEHPWLKTDKSQGREILKKYTDILVKAKQIVIHRLKNFFLTKSDEIQTIFSLQKRIQGVAGSLLDRCV